MNGTLKIQWTRAPLVLVQPHLADGLREANVSQAELDNARSREHGDGGQQGEGDALGRHVVDVVNDDRAAGKAIERKATLKFAISFAVCARWELPIALPASTRGPRRNSPHADVKVERQRKGGRYIKDGAHGLAEHKRGRDCGWGFQNAVSRWALPGGS